MVQRAVARMAASRAAAATMKGSPCYKERLSYFSMGRGVVKETAASQTEHLYQSSAASRSAGHLP
jgi:hypothetical protein